MLYDLANDLFSLFTERLALTQDRLARISSWQTPDRRCWFPVFAVHDKNESGGKSCTRRSKNEAATQAGRSHLNHPIAKCYLPIAGLRIDQHHINGFSYDVELIGCRCVCRSIKDIQFAALADIDGVSRSDCLQSGHVKILAERGFFRKLGPWGASVVAGKTSSACIGGRAGGGGTSPGADVKTVGAGQRHIQ